MVDALEKIKTLLSPNGRLISIQPQAANLRLSVQVGQTATYIGEVDVSYNFPRYMQANAAIEIATESSIYAMQEDQAVDYYVNFDTVAACRQYLEEEWTNAILAESAWEQITALMQGEGEQKQVFYVQKLRFCCLAPTHVSPNPLSQQG